MWFTDNFEPYNFFFLPVNKIIKQLLEKENWVVDVNGLLKLRKMESSLCLDYVKWILNSSLSLFFLFLK